MAETPERKDTKGGTFGRLVPVAVLIAGLAAFFALDLDRYATFDALREHRATLIDFVAARPVAAALVYMAIYAAAVALSVPGGTMMTVAGGFLFGAVACTAMVVVAATLGATLLFLAARTAVGDRLRARAGPFLQRMEDGFRANALSYLLVLRLIPAFPFFIVNLVPAFLGVPLGTYVLGTFVGIVPGTFVFASVGAGLGSVFEAGQDFSIEGILTPEIATALAGLAVLASAPAAYKWIAARRARRAPPP